jgi:3-phosphoshikimate 1-carboxyvinyltransferase
LLLGLLAKGCTEISGLLEGEDVMATARACRALGAKIERKDNGIWKVYGAGVGALLQPQALLDFGNSGTSARLLMGVLASHDFSTELTGDASLQKRPMARVLLPIKMMGARVMKSALDEKLPIVLQGAALPCPITYKMPVASAQVKSAILLAALNTPGRTTIIEREPTRNHTERMLEAFGANISVEMLENERHISIEGEATLTGMPVSVPGDPSSAAFPLVAALIIPGSSVLLKNVLMNETRCGLITTLLEMGASIIVKDRKDAGSEEIADLEVKFSELKGVDVPAARAPSMIDEYPILSIAASFAKGRTTMRGLSELTVKESNRLQAIHDGLGACGIQSAIEGDTLIVEGAGEVQGGASVATHMDHRIAMSFLVLGLAAKKEVRIDDASMIATSFPNFVSLMQSLGAKISI